MLTKERLEDAKAQLLIQRDLVLDLLEKLEEIYLSKKAAARGNDKIEYVLLGASNNVMHGLEQELESVNHELKRINEYSRDLGKKRRRTQRKKY